MRSRLFRIGLGVSLAIFMGTVACLGCALPRFANAENAIVSAESGNLSSAGVESVKEIVPSADDEVVYTTSQGLAVKKQNATLYMTINGMQYEVVGQGNGTLYSNYSIVEYIQPSVGAYINTDYYPNTYTKVETEVLTTSQTLFKNHMILYGGGTNAWTAWFSCWSDAQGFACAYGTGAANSNVQQSVDDISASNSYYHIVQDGRYFNITRGDGVKGSLTFNASTFTSSYPLAICGMNWGGYGSYYALSDFKVYYFKIWDKGVLVRNYIPVKNFSNVVGLFDTINNKFLKSANSYAFTAGPVMASDDNKYVDPSPAGQAIANSGNVDKRVIAGIDFYPGVEEGYLLCKNWSGEYLQVLI